MNLESLKPWNWFKHEEGDHGKISQIPVKRSDAETIPLGRAGSLLGLHREMDRLFDETFKSFGMPSLPASFEPRLQDRYRPQIDISGDASRYEICLDVPGLTEQDLVLEVKDDMLTIKGEKEEHREEKDKHYYRVERSYGSFQRRLALPDDADAAEIKANLNQGVLKLEIPRRAAMQSDAKRISIST